MSIKPLDHPDSMHLDAAIGWLGLKDHESANEELEKLSPELRLHPDVLEVSYVIHSEARKWDVCADIGEALISSVPDRVSSWINRSYALRRATGGSIEKAQQALLPALEKFPDERMIPYNLACYACQLGDLAEAHRLLKIALRKDCPAQLKEMALEDEDLKPLWTKIVEL